MTKLFITGATGYIGGDFLFVATKAHPEWEIACLVRSSTKASKLTSAYPNVRIVLGDLDAESIIEEEASRATVVYHFANSDHMKSALAIARGLARNRSPAAFWIHTGGAGILTYANFAENSFGHALESDKKVFDDWHNVHELTSLPDRALHRHVDKVVLSASKAAGAAPGRIKTAVVAPSCIYGVGRGTGNTLSVQVYVAAEVALANRQAYQVGDGSNVWHEVHIHDLSNLYLLLGEAAAAGGARATWNEQGYYLAESGSFVWGDIVREIARQGSRRGLLGSDTVESVDAEKSKKLHQLFPYLCGTTSRGVSKRAKELLGWKPTGGKMVDDVPGILAQTAQKLERGSKKSRVASL